MAVTNVGYLFQLGLRKVMFRGYEEELENLNVLFNENKTEKPWEEWTGVVGPGVAEEKPKGEDMAYKNILVETPKRILIKTYALGIRVHLEDVEDDQYGALKRLSEMVGRSHRVIREVARANVFNMSFASTTAWRTGYDGFPLCYASHPLQGDTLSYGSAPTFDSSSATAAVPARTTGTWSNVLATASDLDYTSLIDAVTLCRRQVSREGDYINLKPKYLLVPPELEPTAWEVTKSTERPDTANRAMSTVNRFGLQIITSPYLVDPDAWWLIADKTDLQWFDRMAFQTRQRDAEGSWDNLLESMQRFGFGFHDPRGVVGTPGA